MAEVYFNSSPVTEATASAALSVIAVALISASAITEANATSRLTGGNASLQASAQTSLAATASLSASSDIQLQGNAVAAVSAVAELTGKVAFLSGGANASMQAVSSLIGGNASLNAEARTESAAVSSLIGGSIALSGAPISEWVASSTLTGASDLRGKTVCEIIRESLSLWGFLCHKNAPDYAKARAITDLNTALQLIWNNAEGHDYWSNETVEITLSDGESTYDLDDTIQNVVGPCRLASTNRPLAPIRTIGEFGTFADLYLDGETLTEPVAYYVDRFNQTGDEPAKCVLHVTPAVVGADVDLLVEVVKEAPRYTMDDLYSCPAVPIPHRYAETLLIPIIRYNASSYYLFEALDPKQKETIDREYQQAMVSLGLADPNPVKES